MSVKTYIRIIPSILKHSCCKNIFNITKHSRLCNTSGYILSTNFSNIQNIRYLSTKESKDTTVESTNGTQQVYYGILTPQLRAVKIFSLITSFTGLAAQPVIYKQIAGIGNVPLIVMICSFVGFFTIITPFLLHFIAKKYVTTLVYKPESGTFIATTLNLFNIKRELEFTPDDVKVPEVPGMFTSFHVKGKPLFVDPKLFTDPTYYGKLMGYDKPLDLKLYQTSLNEKQK